MNLALLKVYTFLNIYFFLNIHCIFYTWYFSDAVVYLGFNVSTLFDVSMFRPMLQQMVPGRGNIFVTQVNLYKTWFVATVINLIYVLYIIFRCNRLQHRKHVRVHHVICDVIYTYTVYIDVWLSTLYINTTSIIKLECQQTWCW